MATVTKTIGPISAYAIAVANGYTGTEAEFAEEIANASTNAQTAQDAANHCDEVLKSIPEDYSAMSAAVTGMTNAGHDNAYPGYNFLAEGVSGYWYTATGTATESDPRSAPESYPNVKCVSIPVTAGDVFEIAIGTSMSQNRNPWAIIGSDRVPVARSGSTGGTIDYRSAQITLKIPTGGVQLLINYDPVAYPGAYVVRAKRQYNVIGSSYGVPMSSSINGNAAATNNIQSGALFVANDKLYKATAAIATHTSGSGNIIPGTNCTETTVVEQLNALATTSNISISDHALNIP